MIKGSLADNTVPDVVFEVFQSQQSGILRLNQGVVVKKLYFKEGSIVFAHSSLENERLGEILLRLGKITQEEFNVVLKEVEAGKRLGTALMERGFVSANDITAGVNYQLQQIIYSVFNWSDGEYEFTERDRPVFEDIMVNVSTSEILLDGIRNVTNLAVLTKGIGLDDGAVITSNKGTKKIRRSNLDFAEETVLACLGEKSTIGKLKSMTHLAPHEFGRALYSLLISGILTREKSQVEPQDALRTEVQQRWLSFPTDPGVRDLPKEPISRVKTASETELRQMIVDEYKRFRTATDEEVLGILPDCTPSEVQVAYDRLIALYHPLYYSTGRYQEHKDQLKYILDRLATAFDSVKEKLEAQRPLSELPAVLKAVPREEPPPRPTFDGFTSDREYDFQTSAPVPTPPAPTPPPPKPKVPVPAAPVAPAAPSAPVARVAAPIAGDISLEELEAALRREPNNPSVMRQLGRKLQQAGRAKAGEKHMLRALELEPQNIESHFAIADFYQAQGLKFQAFKHLNIILQIQPENEKAMELLGIKKRKKGLYTITGRGE